MNMILPGSYTTDWSSALAKLNLNDSDLLVERVDAGTSNYVLALNEKGQTWSAAIRLPAPGADSQGFISDKTTTLSLLDELVIPLSRGMQVNPIASLRFGGASRFVDAGSTKAFLKRQSGVEYSIISTSTGKRKQLTGLSFDGDRGEPEPAELNAINYINNYSGPFFLSRGAPASETLEQFPELAGDVAEAIGVLHRTFPKKLRPSRQDASHLLDQIRLLVTKASSNWRPAEATKEYRALQRLLGKRWGQRPQIALKEAWLRSEMGRVAINKLVRSRYIDPSRGFVHGDAHGANFIIVWYEFGFDVPNPIAVDREFLNQCFQQSPNVSSLYYSSRTRRAVVDPTPLAGATRILRAPHFEVHPIDLDDASFTSDQAQITDALMFAASCENIAEVFHDTPLSGGFLIERYFGGLGQNL